MKNKIATATALVAASGLSTAEIKINDNLSFEGFVDSSYSHTSNETKPGGATTKESDNSLGIDEVEIDWLLNFNSVTARVDLQHELVSAAGTAVEQAFVTYDLGNGLSVTAGRYESALGLEAKEPTGLNQWSTAYNTHSLATTTPGNVGIAPTYNEGGKITYEANGSSFVLSVQDRSFIPSGNPARFGGDGASSYAIEAAASLELVDGLNFFLGGAFEDAENASGTSINSWLVNGHLTYESGPLTIGGEVVYGDTDGAFVLTGTNEEVMQGLVMANYAYSDSNSVTGRVSYSNHEAKAGAANVEANFLKYTLAHNSAITDNLLLVTEVSYVDGEPAKGTDYKALVGAVEVLFTF